MKKAERFGVISRLPGILALAGFTLGGLGPGGCRLGSPAPLQVKLNDPLIAGYWHNWDSQNVEAFALEEVSPWVTRVLIAFALPDPSNPGSMMLIPQTGSEAELRAGITTLQARGVEVLISIGGANHPVELHTPEMRDRFVASMTNLITDYGFDGLDVDLEGSSLILEEGDVDFRSPTTPEIRHMIEALQAIKTSQGKSFLLSASPETRYVVGGYHRYGGSYGAYLPVLHALREDWDVVHMQLYNSGSQFAYMGADRPDRVVEQGHTDFAVELNRMLIRGFPVGRNQEVFFEGLKPHQVALGLPATPSATGGKGYLPEKDLRQAIHTLSSEYPEFRGVMTWSLNWDRAGNTSLGPDAFVRKLGEMISPEPDSEP